MRPNFLSIAISDLLQFMAIYIPEEFNKYHKSRGRYDCGLN